jgi:hypothetical protein
MVFHGLKNWTCEGHPHPIQLSGMLPLGPSLWAACWHPAASSDMANLRKITSTANLRKGIWHYVGLPSHFWMDHIVTIVTRQIMSQLMEVKIPWFYSLITPTVAPSTASKGYSITNWDLFTLRLHPPDPMMSKWMSRFGYIMRCWVPENKHSQQ